MTGKAGLRARAPGTTALATLALLSVTAAWGSTFVLIKDALERIPVADFLAVRFAIAALALWAVSPGAVAYEPQHPPHAAAEQGHHAPAGPWATGRPGWPAHRPPPRAQVPATPDRGRPIPPWGCAAQTRAAPGTRRRPAGREP